MLRKDLLDLRMVRKHSTTGSLVYQPHHHHRNLARLFITELLRYFWPSSTYLRLALSLPASKFLASILSSMALKTCPSQTLEYPTPCAHACICLYSLGPLLRFTCDPCPFCVKRALARRACVPNFQIPFNETWCLIKSSSTARQAISHPQLQFSCEGEIRCADDQNEPRNCNKCFFYH